MAKPIILTADSTCDLSEALLDRYQVKLYPFHILLDGQTYSDGVDLHPDDIYRVYKEKHVLPKTAAINLAEFIEFFEQFTNDGYEIIHLNLGSGLSSSHNNARMAAEEMEGVYVIDSCSLSTGTGLLVIEAAERIAAGMEAAQIADEVRALTEKVDASFVIDTLEFLYKGGRCSALARLGANLLSLKPCIEVSTENGSMGVGKKYRGTLEKALQQYVKDRLEGRTDLKTDRIFITHSGIDKELIEMVKDLIGQYASFDEIHVTRAGCTISSHCGPGTLGILFLTK